MKNYLKTYIKYLNETKGFWLLAWLFTLVIFGIISNIFIIQNDIFERNALNLFSDKELYMHIDEYNNMAYNIDSFYMALRIAPILVIMIIILELIYKIRFHADSSEGMWGRLPFKNSVKESFFYISSLLLILINGIILIIYAVKECIDVYSIAAKRYQNIISSKGTAFFTEFENGMNTSSLHLFDYSDVFAVVDNIFTVILLVMITVVLFYIVGSLINNKYISVVVRLVLMYCLYEFSDLTSAFEIDTDYLYFDNLALVVILILEFRILLYIRSSFDNTKNRITKLSFVGYLILGYALFMELYWKFTNVFYRISIYEGNHLIDCIKDIFVYDFVDIVLYTLLLIFLFLLNSKDEKKIKKANKVFAICIIGTVISIFDNIINTIINYDFLDGISEILYDYGFIILIYAVLFIVLKKKNKGIITDSYNYEATKDNKNYCKSVILQYIFYMIPSLLIGFYSVIISGTSKVDIESYSWIVSEQITIFTWMYTIMKFLQLYFRGNSGGTSEVNRVAMNRKNKTILKIVCELASYGAMMTTISAVGYFSLCSKMGIGYFIKYTVAALSIMMLIIALFNLSETLISNAVLTGINIISVMYILKYLLAIYKCYWYRINLNTEIGDFWEVYSPSMLINIWFYLVLLSTALIILTIRLSARALSGDSMFYYKKCKIVFGIVIDLAMILATINTVFETYQIAILISAIILITISLLFSKRKIIY